MAKISFCRKNDMLFRTIKLTVNGSTYPLKRNSSLTLDLPEGVYEVCAKLDWCYTNHSVDLTEKDNISLTISQKIPDWYFLAGTSILFVLFILVFIGEIPLWALTIPLVLYYIPLMVNMFVNQRKYFKFT